MVRRILTIAAALCMSATQVYAAGSTATNNVSVTKSSPLRVIATGVTADCAWSPGTIVMVLGVTGGDGQTVTYSLGGTPSGDFAITGSNLVVGSNGIATANCGKVESVVINASQP